MLTVAENNVVLDTSTPEPRQRRTIFFPQFHFVQGLIDGSFRCIHGAAAVVGSYLAQLYL